MAMLFTIAMLVAVVLGGWAIHVVHTTMFWSPVSRSTQMQIIYALAVLIVYITASVFPL